MRAIGLLVLLLGVLTLLAPTLRDLLPFLSPFSNISLWIAGAGILFLGIVMMIMTRDE